MVFGFAVGTSLMPTTKEDLFSSKIQERKYVSASRSSSKLKRLAPREVPRKQLAKVQILTKPVKKLVPQKPVERKLTKPIENPAKVKTTTPLTAKKSEEVKLPVTLSVEPTSQGHYELNPLMSRMLEVELQDVMIKIWQALPDECQDGAEKVVVDKFKNKAGDDLKNMIGLNVTKRLLNVHNDLFVKIVFTGKPIRTDLATFIKKHNITAFKRVGDRNGTFAAKMRTFQDFDELCTAKDLKCGKVSVTVTPCYRFMQCPPNLRTIYDGNGDNKANKNIEKNILKNTDSELKDSNEPQKPKIKTETNTKPVNDDIPKERRETTLKDQNKTNNQNNSNVNKSDTAKKDNEVIKSVAPTEIKNEKKTTENKDNTVKETQSVNTTQNGNDVAKKGEVKPATENKEKVISKISPAKPNPTTENKQIPKVVKSSQQIVENQIVAPKNTPVKASQPATENKAPTKPANPPKESEQAVLKATVSVASPAEVTKAAPKITTKPNQLTESQKIASKASPIKPKAAVTENQLTPAKKPTPTKLLKSPVKAKILPKKKDSDYDELDDHDILALISGGIVLDECSGSEED